MKTFDLKFGPRLTLSNLLGVVSGRPLAQQLALAATYEQIRFTEGELKQIKTTPLDGGRTMFAPPSLDFGTVTVTIEDSQADVLVKEIETGVGLAVPDMVWIRPLLDELKEK